MKLVTHYDRVDRAVDLAFARAVDEVVGEAKKNAPVAVSRGLKLNAGDVQGGLRASITEVHVGRLHARVGSPLRYAMQRERGGTIVPVRKKFLSWRDPITGEWRFARRVVQRPGGPRQGYKAWLEPAGDKFSGFMDDHLRSVT